jgi:hypothetical protein
MLQVTPEAGKQLGEYFKDKPITPVRIIYNSGG